MEIPASAASLGIEATAVHPSGLPLCLHARQPRPASELAAWLRQESVWVGDRLREHGALLLRGFAIPGPAEFEPVARAIDDDLKNHYLGTSPRDALSDYVFSASELPGYYPIPQHCEMSFTAHPPRHLFFHCMVAPAAGSGETPLVDFRKVYRDLDARVLERFETGGVRIVRNYAGLDGGGRFDLWKLKRWDEMFGTTDQAEAERQCRAEGFEPTWGPGGRLRLVSTQPATARHPETGVPLWFNHSQVFHQSAVPGEFRRIHGLRPSLRSWFFWKLGEVLVRWNRRARSSDDQALHCTYRDGREIPEADMEHVRDVIWRHLVAVPWQTGDVVAIDNYAVSHGRLPYRGPRQIAVCWA